MNKLIYAIGIAVATTFTSNTKVEKNNADTIKKQGIEQIDKLPLVNEMDSINTIL